MSMRARVGRAIESQSAAMCFLPGKKHQTQSRCSVLTAGALLAQGATEYLVLLAVVLIVALVSVALLGFFPGMASDAQRQQSEMYWRSASPIAITEWAAKAADGTWTFVYFRFKNNGAYTVRVTGIIGADGNKSTQVWDNTGNCGGGVGLKNISSILYLAPGEENYLSVAQGVYGAALACDRQLYFKATASGDNNVVSGASSVCSTSATAPGTAIMQTMDIEYIEYFENGQQITKQQSGKQVIIKCLPA